MTANHDEFLLQSEPQMQEFMHTSGETGVMGNSKLLKIIDYF